MVINVKINGTLSKEVLETAIIDFVNEHKNGATPMNSTKKKITDQNYFQENYNTRGS
jgi:hypothetical protein